MNKSMILLALLLLTGCVSEQRKWYERLRAVDAGWISDSAIWAISHDHNMVIEIERSDAATKTHNLIAALRYQRTIRDSIEGVREFPFGGRRLLPDTFWDDETGKRIIVDTTN